MLSLLLDLQAITKGYAIMFTKETVACPVCRGLLGYRAKNEACSFVCRECRWIYCWNEKGKLGQPIKVEDKRKPEVCDCGGCQARDEKKASKI